MKRMRLTCDVILGLLIANISVWSQGLEQSGIGNDQISRYARYGAFTATVHIIRKTSVSGSKVQVTQWEANDLNGFPIKSESRSGQDLISTQLIKDINTAKPDPALFVPPSDYKRDASMEERLKNRFNKSASGGDRK